MATDGTAFRQGEHVAFGGHLLKVALVINVTAPMDPGDVPGLYLAVRLPNWPKGQVWIIPARLVDKQAPLVA